ncbi:MAG: rhamnogalacturonan acetylesterase [Gammaproteobacteria bacterium]
MKALLLAVLALPGFCHAAEPVIRLGPLKPGYTLVDLPEGNYNVTVTLGGAQAASTTVKAELRRLMLERVVTRPGQTVQRTFTVNVRTPVIDGTGAVQLKAPRETVEEAWAWDPRLTLEVGGDNPAVKAVEIVRADTPTLFLLGDSTVCDQPGEPYSSWGQMLPRFFKAGLAVANHAESGETLRDSLARRRLDKIISVMKPGDTVLFQFGHNDQKQIREGTGSPATYEDELRTHVRRVLARGGIPVVVSSMERRAFDAQGKVVPSLHDYADAARQVASEEKVKFIDLNAQSIVLYQALGQDGSRAAFAQPAPGKIDNTHHNSYGGYELAKIVVTALRAHRLPVAAFIADDFRDFDPAQPDPAAAFDVPASPAHSSERPLGDEANR